MSDQFDFLDDLTDQMSFAGNSGTRRKHWRRRCGLSPSLERAKVARPAPESPAAAASPPEAVPAAAAANTLPTGVPSVPRVITDRDELVDLIRRRRDELGVTHLTIDALAGWADGLASKLLAPVPIKQFGEKSLQLVLGALALGIARIEFVEDPELAAKMRGRWTARKRPPFANTRGTLLRRRQQQRLASTESANVQTPFVPPET